MAEKSAEALLAEKNPHAARKARLLADRAEAEAKLREQKGIRRRTNAAIIRADFWRAGFKRVRLFMVRRVLAHLELEVASAAFMLGLVGWKIEFSTELETKSGSIRSGIHIVVSSSHASAPWEVWSGGEGQRVRLAVALGLSSMIQRMAGISMGFEVFDEPSAWLSAEGIEDLLAALKHRVEINHKSAWLCDHRALIYSGFSEIWQVRKDADGSSLRMLSNQEM
jgi:DNA repair exonuclease SbcCD ATPase subunit